MWNWFEAASDVGVMVKKELVDMVLAVEWRNDRLLVSVMSFGKVEGKFCAWSLKDEKMSLRDGRELN